MKTRKLTQKEKNSFLEKLESDLSPIFEKKDSRWLIKLADSKLNEIRLKVKERTK